MFENKKANFNKLLAYGFIKNDDKFLYSTEIVDNQFIFYIEISSNEIIKTKIIEKATEDKYFLHLTNATGGFVGKVRTEYEQVLQDISNNCFEKNIFKSEQALKIIDYIRQKYGDELEFLWEKFSDNAIWRRSDNKKWYALLLIIPKTKLKINNDEKVEILDLRVDSNKILELVDNKTIFEGYHMNKKHWITICLDGSVSLDDIYQKIDESYLLAKK